MRQHPVTELGIQLLFEGNMLSPSQVDQGVIDIE
jgi:hypothetical protein